MYTIVYDCIQYMPDLTYGLAGPDEQFGVIHPGPSRESRDWISNSAPAGGRDIKPVTSYNHGL